MAEPAETAPEPTVADAHDEGDSLVVELKELAQDAQTAVEAEVHFQSVRAGYVLGEVKGIALWGGLALVAALIALFALAMGALLGLTPLIGPWAATALVVVALLALAGLAWWIASRGVGRLSRNAFPKSPS